MSLIWVDGRIVPDDALRVSVLDRTFEHGLGLFETLRTWNGRALLLHRHLARLKTSAEELGLPLEPSHLPNGAAVADLLRAEGLPGDAMLRITLTGGHSGSDRSTLWMRAASLPPPTREGGAVISNVPTEVARTEPLARYKTLNYWSHRRAFDWARAQGFDEILTATTGGICYWQGTRTNLFLVKNGALITPSLEGPVLPGIMRAIVLEHARALSWRIHEWNGVSRALLSTADEIFLTNSVRGIIPVGRAVGDGWPGPGPWTWSAPGDWTRRLAARIEESLRGSS